MIPMRPFQLRIFCDALIGHLALGSIRCYTFRSNEKFYWSGQRNIFLIEAVTVFIRSVFAVAVSTHPFLQKDTQGTQKHLALLPLHPHLMHPIYLHVFHCTISILHVLPPPRTQDEHCIRWARIQYFQYVRGLISCLLPKHCSEWRIFHFLRALLCCLSLPEHFMALIMLTSQGSSIISTSHIGNWGREGKVRTVAGQELQRSILVPVKTK